MSACYVRDIGASSRLVSSVTDVQFRFAQQSSLSWHEYCTKWPFTSYCINMTLFILSALPLPQPFAMHTTSLRYNILVVWCCHAVRKLLRIVLASVFTLPLSILLVFISLFSYRRFTLQRVGQYKIIWVHAPICRLFKRGTIWEINKNCLRMFFAEKNWKKYMGKNCVWTCRSVG